MATVEELLAHAQQLSFWEQLRLLESLAEAVRRKAITTQTDWHTFLEETYGILADDPIERPPQGQFEEREPLE
jgi:hypothetical protein